MKNKVILKFKYRRCECECVSNRERVQSRSLFMEVKSILFNKFTISRHASSYALAGTLYSCLQSSSKHLKQNHLHILWMKLKFDFDFAVSKNPVWMAKKILVNKIFSLFSFE
jgi:hypothetical protein